MSAQSQWPSTTEILRRFGLMADYEDWSNPRVMQRGRLVTAACHVLGQGQSLGDWEQRHPECNGYEVALEPRPAFYLDAYRKFLRDHRFKLIEWERQYVSEEYRFISHPDQIGELDAFGIVDLELKSGSMPAWCRLQTAGQVLAMKQPAMRRFGLLLKPDGTYRLHAFDDFRDLDRFRNLIETFWILNEFRTADD